MTEEKRKYINYSFRWGSIIGFITFILLLTGFYTHLDKQNIFSDIYFFIQMLLIIFMLIQYKRILDPPATFLRLFYIGFLAALVIAVFYSLYYILLIAKLDPLFFDNYMYDAAKMLKDSMGIDYSSANNPSTAILMKISFIITTFISSLISSVIYILLSCLCIKINERLFQKR
ncbi:MAG: DUF4199 domain-containing protein [Bacteroidales bacterium]|nr:DUF4199 domain-containing protein [Bacteroidales bacterium]